MGVGNVAQADHGIEPARERGVLVESDVAVLDREVVRQRTTAANGGVEHVLHLEPVYRDVRRTVDTEEVDRVATVEYGRVCAIGRVVLPRLAVIGGGDHEGSRSMVGAGTQTHDPRAATAHDRLRLLKRGKRCGDRGAVVAVAT